MLEADQAEQMQGIELARIACQHGPINQLGFAEPALAMQHHALLDILHRVVRRLERSRIFHAGCFDPPSMNKLCNVCNDLDRSIGAYECCQGAIPAHQRRHMSR